MRLNLGVSYLRKPEVKLWNYHSFSDIWKPNTEGKSTGLFFTWKEKKKILAGTRFKFIQPLITHPPNHGLGLKPFNPCPRKGSSRIK